MGLHLKHYILYYVQSDSRAWQRQISPNLGFQPRGFNAVPWGLGVNVDRPKSSHKSVVVASMRPYMAKNTVNSYQPNSKYRW